MEVKASRWQIVRLGGPFLALRYRRAAQLDESHGLPFAAAMNWRKAAELSSWIALLADFYWRQWERVMHLPRRLAGPIGLAPTTPQNASRHLGHSLQPLVQSQAPVRQAG